jgi:hypothetical protein
VTTVVLPLTAVVASSSDSGSLVELDTPTLQPGERVAVHLRAKGRYDGVAYGTALDASTVRVPHYLGRTGSRAWVRRTPGASR